MRFKLNYTQLEGMQELILCGLTQDRPTTMQEKLLNELVARLSERIRTRLMRLSIQPKDKAFSFSMSTIEYRAFYVWFSMHRNAISLRGFQYELNVCNNLTLQILKHDV